MPLLPVSVIDTFSRSVSDDWGTSDNGCPWGGEGSTAYDVNGTDGTIVVAANASYRSTYLDISSLAIGDQASDEILIEAKWSGSASFPRTDFGPILSRTSSGTFYFA